ATKGKDSVPGAKDGKSLLSGPVPGEASWAHQRQRRLQDHGKERRELLSTSSSQCTEKKPEGSGPETEPCLELHTGPVEPLARVSTAGSEGGRPEQPFIVLSQEEYGEHHSSIMHCRVDCSGRRVASLDVDGVIKVWSFNPIMQTKASSISKSPLLSLEWATKRDRLLLLGSGVGTVRLYDTEAKKNLCEININDDMPRILSLACSPNGASFVCSAAAPSLTSQVDSSALDIGSRGMNQVPGKLLLWDTKTMKQQLQFSLDPEPIAINCTAFNHNGNLLVTGAADGVIRLFDMQQNECAMSWKAHSGEVYSVEFSCDENAVYSIGEDGKFIQWNIHKSGLKVSEHNLPSDATGPFVLSGYSGYKQVQVPRGRLFAFDSEGNYMLTCSATGGIIYKVQIGPWPESLYLLAPATKTVYCMNEAEMVAVALEILIESRKQEEPSLVATDKLRLSPPCSASPRTSSLGSGSEEEGSGNSSPALDLSPSQEPEAADSPCSRSLTEEEEEEEDVLNTSKNEVMGLMEAKKNKTAEDSGIPDTQPDLTLRKRTVNSLHHDAVQQSASRSHPEEEGCGQTVSIITQSSS
ncbi:hypothetical protein STEG23_021052, partial [Scotinomys teguina]